MMMVVSPSRIMAAGGTSTAFVVLRPQNLDLHRHAGGQLCRATMAADGSGAVTLPGSTAAGRAMTDASIGSPPPGSMMRAGAFVAIRVSALTGAAADDLET